jgi:hypothetical protein
MTSSSGCVPRLQFQRCQPKCRLGIDFGFTPSPRYAPAYGTVPGDPLRLPLATLSQNVRAFTSTSCVMRMLHSRIQSGAHWEAGHTAQTVTQLLPLTAAAMHTDCQPSDDRTPGTCMSRACAQPTTSRAAQPTTHQTLRTYRRWSTPCGQQVARRWPSTSRPCSPQRQYQFNTRAYLVPMLHIFASAPDDNPQRDETQRSASSCTQTQVN